MPRINVTHNGETISQLVTTIGGDRWTEINGKWYIVTANNVAVGLGLPTKPRAKNKPIRETLADALSVLGWERCPQRDTGKYTAWIGPNADTTCIRFIGKSGALREGKTASQSVSCEGKLRNKLIRFGQTAYAHFSREQVRKE